jgi:elongator complex protein 3
MLEYGVTRVELGVQTLRDEVLKSTNRGHDLQETADAFAALRDAGLKITAHMMPGLPGTTPEIDIEDFHTLYYNPRFIPDEMKIYPTQVIENTPLAEMVLSGEYKGLTNEETFRIMKEAKLMTPPFVRIKRALRDLPIPMVMDGPTWADMRARIQKDLDQVEAIKCRCIRCREIGMNYYKDPENFKLGEVKQVLRSYEASDGQEHFLSYEDENEILIGFVRLRYPSKNIIFKGLENASIIRELHVYGSALAIDDVSDPHINQSFQHKGYGRKLLQWAEDMTLEAGYGNIAVISGVGVREYYRKFGYELDEHDRFYMVKKLK